MFLLLGYATNWKTFDDVKKQNIGQDKPEYFTTKATIVFLKKENCMYMVRFQQHWHNWWFILILSW